MSCQPANCLPSSRLLLKDSVEKLLSLSPLQFCTTSSVLNHQTIPPLLPERQPSTQVFSVCLLFFVLIPLVDHHRVTSGATLSPRVRVVAPELLRQPEDGQGAEPQAASLLPRLQVLMRPVRPVCILQNEEPCRLPTEEKEKKKCLCRRAAMFFFFSLQDSQFQSTVRAATA